MVKEEYPKEFLVTINRIIKVFRQICREENDATDTLDESTIAVGCFSFLALGELIDEYISTDFTDFPEGEIYDHISNRLIEKLNVHQAEMEMRQ